MTEIEIDGKTYTYYGDGGRGGEVYVHKGEGGRWDVVVIGDPLTPETPRTVQVSDNRAYRRMSRCSPGQATPDTLTSTITARGLAYVAYGG